MPVTYQDLKGRRVTPNEARMVEALRKEALLYVEAAADPRNLARATPIIPDALLVRRCMHMHEIMLPDAIAMLLCEDIGPDHALIERIEAMRIVIEDLDSPRGVLRGSTYKRHCLGLLRRIEELFKVSRTEAYRDLARSPDVALLPEPLEVQADAVAKAASAARKRWPEVSKSVRKAQSSRDRWLRSDPE
jgi:hypothetical protein